MVSLFSTKLEKLFDLRPSPAGFIFCSGGLSGLSCFRERRPDSFSEEAGLFRGRFGMASAAVPGVVVRVVSDMASGRYVRDCFGMAPRSHVRDRSIHIRVGGRVLLRNRLPPHIALSSYFRLFLRLGFPADGRPVALHSCRHPFPAALSLFLRMRFPAKREPGPRRSGLFRSGDSPPLPNYFFSAFRFTSLAAFLASSGFFDVALLS